MFGGTTSTRRSKLLKKKLFVSFLTVKRFQGIREEFFSRFNQLINLKDFSSTGIEFVQKLGREELWMCNVLVTCTFVSFATN